MPNLSNRGFTLIELLLVITILSIALGIGLPAMGNLVETSERKALLNDLLSGISHARTQAITRGVNVTLCPLNDNNRCTRDWNRPIAVFSDPGRTRKLQSEADILQLIPEPSTGNLYGRTGIRKHFAFRPTGMARDSIGHLLWCPEDDQPENAFQIRINMGGRPILARDSNKDGIVEDAYGRNVNCP